MAIITRKQASFWVLDGLFLTRFWKNVVLLETSRDLIWAFAGGSCVAFYCCALWSILHCFCCKVDDFAQFSSNLIKFNPFWVDLTYKFRLEDFCKGRLLAFYCCALWSILRCFCYKVDAFAQFLASFSSFITKGQIISKYLFVSSNFSKKQTITRRIAVETNSLFVFWKNSRFDKFLSKLTDLYVLVMQGWANSRLLASKVFLISMFSVISIDVFRVQLLHSLSQFAFLDFSAFAL